MVRRASQCLLLDEGSGSENGEIFVPAQNAVSAWKVEEVANWISDLGLNEYDATFREHEIDGQELLHLTHDTLLTSLKIAPLGHRNKILRSVQALRNPLWQHMGGSVDDNVSLPAELICPITHEFLRDPVVAADGYTYENSAISEWLANGNISSPMTNEQLAHKELIPNLTLSLLLKKYLSP